MEGESCGISALHRRDEASPRTGSRRLQIDLEHLELDGQRWLRDKRVQNIFGHVWVDWPKALHKTPANAIHDLDVVVLALHGRGGSGP